MKGEVVKKFDVEGFKPMKAIRSEWKGKRIYYNLLIQDGGQRRIGYVDVATGRKVDDKKIAHLPQAVKEWWVELKPHKEIKDVL